jgi:hypothetical protein
MTWTKFSERLPEEGVGEVFVAWPQGIEVSKRQRSETWSDYRDIVSSVADLAWHPITYPELPKEPHQSVKDHKAADSAWSDAQHKCALNGGGWFTEGFFAALRYERAEVAKSLAHLPREYTAIVPETYFSSLGVLRRRVGLDK